MSLHLPLNFGGYRMPTEDVAVKFCSVCGGRKVGRRCPPCAREQAAAWRAKNPESKKISNALWRLNYPEKARESSVKSREKSPEKTKSAQAAWIDKNREKVRETNKIWKETNRLKIRAKETEDRSSLSDAYLAKLLNRPIEECSREMLELKREKLLLDRKLRALLSEKK